MSIRSAQNEGRYLFFFSFRMFVTEGKRGEMEIVQNA